MHHRVKLTGIVMHDLIALILWALVYDEMYICWWQVHNTWENPWESAEL